MRRTQRILLEIAFDDAREDPPHLWDWNAMVEDVKVIEASALDDTMTVPVPA